MSFEHQVKQEVRAIGSRQCRIWHPACLAGGIRLPLSVFSRTEAHTSVASGDSMKHAAMPWHVELGNGPLVAAAIHDGHAVRDELRGLFAISEDQRLREEDPFTGLWTDVAPTRLIGLRSRFEIDLNRPRKKAVYQKPQDAWGVSVWKTRLSPACIDRSLAIHDAFYDETRGVLQRLVARHGRVVVFDLHSYNHRRLGADSSPADATENPEVNVGTGTMDRSRWGSIVDRFIVDMRNFDFLGRHLDVRENVKFRGGYFPQWIHERFEDSVCVISIEFKKFFMDEWTGEADTIRVSEIGRALKSTVWGVYEELVRLGLTDRGVSA